MYIDNTKKIHEQITKESWTQGTSYRDKNGNLSHHPQTEECVSACAIGWVTSRYWRVGGGQSENEAYIKLANVLPEGATLLGYNDDPNRTFQEMLELFKAADI